ncbi:MAG: c-type cytochrome [Novosphingobium sp.]
MRGFGLAFVGFATLGLAACGGGDKASDSSTTGTTSGEAAAPVAEATPAEVHATETGPSLASAPPEFGQCVSCHTIRPGLNAVGPSLFGVFGRKAGTTAGYAYSDANKNSGLTWDEATLDTYLTAPMKMVPGTKMTFAGVPDPAKRKAIIEFLKTVK